MKNKLKKVDKKTEEMFKASSVAVLLENLNDNIKVIAEGQVDLGRKIDRLDDRMDNMEGKMDNMEARMGNMEGRMGNIEGRMDNMEGKVDNMEGKVDNLGIEMKEGFSLIMDYLKKIDEEVVSIRKDVEMLKEKKADRDENAILEKRLEKVEKEMMSLKNVLIKKKVIA
jgi:chromosome segregation ATPase